MTAPLESDDNPDVGLRDDEVMCPLSGYVYPRALPECPHHWHEEVSCK